MTSLPFLFPNTENSPVRSDIMSLFSVERSLAQRGFDGFTEQPLEVTLIPNLFPRQWSETNVRDRIKITKTFLDQLNARDFRHGLRDFIFGISKTRPISDLDLSRIEQNLDSQERYARTFELLLAFLAVRDLRSLSASFGVYLAGAPEGGDFDVIANQQSQILYMEVKSGAVRNIDRSDCDLFVRRAQFLAPGGACLFLDYQQIDSDWIKGRFANLETLSPGFPNRILKYTHGGLSCYAVSADILVVDVARNNNLLANLRLAFQTLERFRSFAREELFWNLKPGRSGMVFEEIK